MANVTYLLGAGASYDALPVVEKFEEEIGNVMSELRTRIVNRYPFGDASTTLSPEVRTALDDLSFLLKGCKEHSSVDTFARKFYLTKDGDGGGRRVKLSIILFFELYYELFKKVDKRYDSFLSSILNVDIPRLPDHIKVISWNYDYEMERAFNKYISNSASIDDAYSEMNVQHKGAVFGSTSLPFMVKLNGTVGYKDTQGKVYLGETAEQDEPSKKEVFEDDYARLKWIIAKHRKHWNPNETPFNPAISFAWEEDARDEVANNACSIIKNTNSLVIVGYSFPYFNRFVDRTLLGSIEYGYNVLTKIYVQDPNANDIIESIKAIVPNEWHGSINFIPLSNTNQFYMPYELE